MTPPAALFFVLRLLPPRATFARDMTPAELVAMRAHVDYWKENLNAGHAVVFGPVADPKGPWGLAVVRVTGDDHLRGLMANDPAILAAIGCSYEVLPMPQAVTRA